ncbi:MAG TPA: hypothetical protein VFB82_23090, partial [Blastocatellia bacterium]|nr:hypothetical protein [Blastocatellia bacterium]
MDLILNETLSFELTPQFIEVLEWLRLVELFRQLVGRSNKLLKRFHIIDRAQHPTESGVLMRTRLA